MHPAHRHARALAAARGELAHLAVWVHGSLPHEVEKALHHRVERVIRHQLLLLHTSTTTASTSCCCCSHWRQPHAAHELLHQVGLGHRRVQLHSTAERMKWSSQQQVCMSSA
jgi:hypothetical protein